MEIPKLPMLFLQNDSCIPLLRTAPTQIIEHREVKVMPSYSVCQYNLVSWMWGAILQATKRKYKQQPSYKIFDPQSVLPARYARALVA